MQQHVTASPLQQIIRKFSTQTVLWQLISMRELLGLPPLKEDQFIQIDWEILPVLLLSATLPS